MTQTLAEAASEALRLARRALYELIACDQHQLEAKNHALAAIDAALASQPAGAGWQPIETAPKVVGRIIGCVDGRARFICWGKASHVPMFGWVLTDQGPEECDLCEPTHWMPLPGIPARTQQENGQ